MYDNGVIEDLEGAVDRLCSADPASLSDTEAMVALHRCLSKLEAAVTRASAAFDASGHWRRSGARSASAWMAARCGMPRATASRRVQLGRCLRHLPVAEVAWLAGEVGEAQVAALARARTPATEAALARDEALLVAKATELHDRSFRRVLAYWAQHADPDGTEADAERSHRERSFWLASSFAGRWRGEVVLDAVSGEVVSEALRRIEDELFAADWAEARRRTGDAACTDDLSRTPAQRRADALVEMARRAGRAPLDGRRPEPLFTVLVGYETLAGRICELASGPVVSPGSLLPWLDQASIERVVFEGPSRVIDVGVTRRLFAGATRRAVEVRDRECFHPTCDLPAERCQIDHVEPFAAGGRTVAVNGRPACGQHNRGRNRPP